MVDVVVYKVNLENIVLLACTDGAESTQKVKLRVHRLLLTVQIFPLTEPVLNT